MHRIPGCVPLQHPRTLSSQEIREHFPVTGPGISYFAHFRLYDMDTSGNGAVVHYTGDSDQVPGGDKHTASLVVGIVFWHFQEI